MSITPLPPLDRTAPTFRADVDTYFAEKIPQFAVETEAARAQIVATGAAVTGAVAAVDADALAAVGAKNDANNSRVQAALSAGTATTKAGEAADSASLAATKRQEAVDARNIAVDSKDIAVAQAALSQKYATQTASEVTPGGGFGAKKYAADAAASALQAGAPLTGTSATSLALSISSKTLTTQLGKAWTPGQMVVLARTSAPVTQRMSGTITAYDAATGSMTVLIAEFTGAGTFTDWTIGVTGPRGASSLTLPVQQVSANLTGVSNVIYALTAPVVLKMPANSADGDFFGFSNRSTGQPSIDPNGKTIKGAAGIMGLDSPVASALLRYDAATNDWVESFQGFTVASISTNVAFLQANTWAAKQTFQGFTVLGELSPATKYARYTGTTAAAQGNAVTIAHGLDRTKIISITAVVTRNPNDVIPPEFSASAGFQYSVYAGPVNVTLQLSSANSANLLSMPFSILVGYME